MVYEFILRHLEFYVILGCFIFFRVVIRTGTNDLDTFCQTRTTDPSPKIIKPNPEIRDYWLQFRGGEHVVELFEPVSASLFLHPTSTGSGMDPASGSRLLFVIFYSPNCVYCTKSVPEFAAGAELVFKNAMKKERLTSNKESLNRKGRDCDFVQFVAVNCRQNPKTCHDEKVDGYPSFVLYRDGARIEEYINLRTAPKFAEYIKGHQRKLGTSSGWRSWISFQK